MITVIHDLTPAEIAPVLAASSHEIQTISPSDGAIHKCIGCFGCWTKTPGRCVLKDSYCEIGMRLAQSERLVLISKMTYGGFSPFVKTCLDRSIGYLLPFFAIRNNEMHHASRYREQFSLQVVSYGPSEPQERETLRSIVRANALNYNAKSHRVVFLEDLNHITKLQEVFV